MTELLDRQYMSRALELAQRARGYTSPNPMVGAVIVRNGRIVSEGFHRRKGSAHAEVVALKKAGAGARGATVYVNLEPCCHVGCTGPCTEALIKAGVGRVVYSAVDPNPIVSGKGDRRLRRAGIRVERGLMHKEAERLNEAYFAYHRNGRPFVTLKMAQSLDGCIATASGDSQWISSPASLKLAHQLRAENDAVMVGAGTVRSDNPALTVRLVRGRNPYRIVVAGKRPLSAACRLLQSNDDSRTIIAGTPEAVAKHSRQARGKGMTFWEVKSDRSGRVDLSDLMIKAGDFGLQSLLVEGGSTLASALVKARLVDKVVTVIAPMMIGNGKPSVNDLGVRELGDSIRLMSVSFDKSGSDLVVTGYPESRGR